METDLPSWIVAVKDGDIVIPSEVIALSGIDPDESFSLGVGRKRIRLTQEGEWKCTSRDDSFEQDENGEIVYYSNGRRARFLSLNDVCPFDKVGTHIIIDYYINLIEWVEGQRVKIQIGKEGGLMLTKVEDTD